MNGQVEVTNLPMTVLWIIAIAQIIFALAVSGIAIVLIILMKSLLGQLKEILADVKEMERELKGRVPNILKNVDGMVNDVAGTTHKGTGVANQVLNVVGAMRGANKREREVIIERDTRGRGRRGK
jgi:uncharacterized protein YoxC